MAQKQQIKLTQEWLDERFVIMNMENPPRQADISFYHGGIKSR